MKTQPSNLDMRTILFSKFHLRTWPIILCLCHGVALAQTNPPSRPGLAVEPPETEATVQPPAEDLQIEIYKSPAPVHMKPGLPITETRAALETFRARDALTLFDYLPNTKASEGFSERIPFFTVRGSREPNVDDFQMGRGAVGMYVDDMPIADVFGRALLLSDIQRVEFYNFPQGARFGIPHSAGLLNISTRMPDNTWRGLGAYSYGSYQAHEVRAQLSGPLVQDDLFAGIGGLFQMREGYFDNHATGEPYGDRERLSGNARLRWTPTDNLEFLFTTGADHFDDDAWIWVPVQSGRSPFDVNKPRTGLDQRDQLYQSLRVTWHVSDWEIKSITSHRRFTDHLYDPSFLFGTLPFPSEVNLDQRFDTWTQEIRAENRNDDAAWRERAGFYFAQSDFRHRLLQTPIGEGKRHSKLRDYTLYGQAERRIGERLNLLGGLRLQLNDTSSHVEFTPFPGFPAPPLRDAGSRTFGGVLPTAETRWAWNERQITYARFAVAMQPGGQRRASPESRDYNAQTSYHYELGHKAAWNEGRLILHGDVFYTEYENYQTFHLTPIDVTMANAKHAHALGVEGDAAWEICDGLKFSAAAACTEAEFDTYHATAGRDLSGNAINNIPEYTLQTTLEYRARWGGLAWCNWRKVGRYELEDTNASRQSAYSIVDARIGYESKRIGIYVFGNNLLDERYFSNAYRFVGFLVGTPGAPRTFGMEIKAWF